MWQGGYIHATVPIAYADTIETLLGKRGSIQDRHTLAARDTMMKISNMLSSIVIISASWDETAMMWQLIARGIVGYAPIADAPRPPLGRRSILPVCIDLTWNKAHCRNMKFDSG